MRRLSSLLLTLIILPIFCYSSAELAPDLTDKMSTSPEDELIPITIRLTEQMTEMERDTLTQDLDREASRLVIVNRLKEIAENTQGSLLDLLQSYEESGKVKEINSLWVANVVACKATKGVISEISELSSVAYIGYDQPVDPLCEIVWGIEKVNADDVWNMSPTGYTGAGVVTADQDTGCDITHPDIEDHLWENTDEIPNNGVDDDGNGYTDDYHGYDFYHDDGTIEDYNGHGTHTAGTICGDGTDGSQTGMAPDASLMVCEMDMSVSSSSEQAMWEAYQYELDNGADVVNCSFGWVYTWNPDKFTWRETIENCTAGGLFFCIAAGNERHLDNYYPVPNNIRTPGNVPDCICCAATDSSDNYSYFSSYGPVEWDEDPPYDDYPWPPGLDKPDISAPGSNVKSTKNGGGYTNKSGTSMATPHLTGAVALLLEADPDATWAEIKDAIYSTAVDCGDTGYDHDYGYGRLDIFEAVNYLLGTQEINVLYFVAENSDNNVLLSWDIHTDENLLGFNILRTEVDTNTSDLKKTKTPGADDFNRINDSLITGEGPYKFVDTDISENTFYLYKLEAVTDSSENIIGIAKLNSTSFSHPTTISQIYPNPIQDRATISFSTEVDTDVEFTIYDISGRRISTIETDNYERGEHEASLNTDNLTDGVYIMKMTTDDTISTKRFVVSK